MKRSILAITILFLTFTVAAQSVPVMEMLGENRWLELDEYLQQHNEEVHPMIELIGRTMAAEGMNRPQEAIECGMKLIATYANDLGSDNILSIAYVVASNLGRMGKWGQSADFLENVLQQMASYTNSQQAETFADYVHQMRVLAKYEPLNAIQQSDTPLCIDFDLDGMDFVGIGWKAINMHAASINGIPIRCIFDSGAGDNIINSRIANQLGLRITDVEVPLTTPFGQSTSRLAIADEVRIGELTIHNATFHVSDLNAVNDSLNDIISNIEMIIGMPLLHSARHVTIDFDNLQVIVGGQSPVPYEVEPNLYLCGGNMHCRVTLCDSIIATLLCDTGDATSGTITVPQSLPLGEKIMSVGEREMAKVVIGDLLQEEARYKLTDVPLAIGETSTFVPQLQFRINADASHVTGSLSLSMMRSLRRLTYDMDRMVLYPCAKR